MNGDGRMQNFFFSINNDMLELDYDLLVSRRKRLEKL